MAYTPINWQTGDTITAEKLNRCDNGWVVESSSQQLFSETVTTTLDPDYPDDPAWGALAYSTLITADTLTVTFDGTDYVCEKHVMLDGNVYGGWGDDGADFTDYPFAIYSSEFMGDINNSVATATGGTYTVVASSTSSSIETSEQFQIAVNSCVDTSTMPMECVSGVTTFSDMARAYAAGRIMFFKPYETTQSIRIITDISSGVVTFIPADQNVTATFESDVFTVSISV